MAKANKTRNPVKIVVLQRGWVAVGRFKQIGQECSLEPGYVVRIWGTTKGLPEIANDGPTQNTKLDGPVPIRFHELTVVMALDCSEEKWAKVLG